MSRRSFFGTARFGRRPIPTRLKDDLAAPSLAHADIYSIWMSFAGIATVVAPTKEPEIFGKVSLTDLKSAVPCSALAP